MGCTQAPSPLGRRDAHRVVPLMLATAARGRGNPGRSPRPGAGCSRLSSSPPRGHTQLVSAARGGKDGDGGGPGPRPPRGPCAREASGDPPEPPPRLAQGGARAVAAPSVAARSRCTELPGAQGPQPGDAPEPGPAAGRGERASLSRGGRARPPPPARAAGPRPRYPPPTPRPGPSAGGATAPGPAAEPRPSAPPVPGQPALRAAS